MLPRGYVRGHVADQRDFTCIRDILILSTLDGVVRSYMQIGGVRRDVQFVGNEGVAFILGGGGKVGLTDDVGFLDRLGGPGAGVDVGADLALGQEIHGDERKLSRSAAAHEQYFVVVAQAERLAHERHRLLVYFVEFRRAVRGFHDRHAGAAVVEQFFLYNLEHVQRQGRRTGVEIENSMSHFIHLISLHMSKTTGGDQSFPALCSPMSWSIISPMRFIFSTVDDPIWGVISTLGASLSGLSAGGGSE